MNNIFVDSQGAILQTNGDAGDSCARTFQYISGLEARKKLGISNDEWPAIEYAKLRNLFVLPDGVCLRYHSPPYDRPFDKEWGTSRDQAMPVVIAATFMQDTDTVERIWTSIKKNYMRFPNGDLCGPGAIGIIKRGLGKSFYLNFCDLELLANSWIRRIQARDLDNVGDDVLHVQYMMQCYFFGKTTVSEWARKVYSKRDPQYAYDRYFRPESHANPLNELYRPIIEAMK